MDLYNLSDHILKSLCFVDRLGRIHTPITLRDNALKSRDIKKARED